VQVAILLIHWFTHFAGQALLGMLACRGMGVLLICGVGIYWPSGRAGYFSGGIAVLLRTRAEMLHAGVNECTTHLWSWWGSCIRWGWNAFVLHAELSSRS